MGMWSSNLKEGPGVLTLASGDTYEGQFKQDKKHGRGTFSWGEVRLGRVFLTVDSWVLEKWFALSRAPIIGAPMCGCPWSSPSPL